MTKIRAETIKILSSEYNIEAQAADELFQKGFLSEHECRNALIRHEYLSNVRKGEKMRLKGKLADKYCVSIKLIEKILQRQD